MRTTFANMIGLRPYTRCINRSLPKSRKTMPQYILIVDDDPDIRQILQDRLESYGYLVDTAEDGLAAIQKIERRTPSGVFLDIRMPGMSGIELLGRIRDRYRTLSVVIVTATNTADLSGSPVHTAAQACLVKPFDMPQIRQVAEQCFGPAPGSEHHR